MNVLDFQRKTARRAPRAPYSLLTIALAGVSLVAYAGGDANAQGARGIPRGNIGGGNRGGSSAPQQQPQQPQQPQQQQPQQQQHAPQARPNIPASLPPANAYNGNNNSGSVILPSRGAIYNNNGSNNGGNPFDYFNGNRNNNNDRPQLPNTLGNNNRNDPNSWRPSDGTPFRPSAQVPGLVRPGYYNPGTGGSSITYPAYPYYGGGGSTTIINNAPYGYYDNGTYGYYNNGGYYGNGGGYYGNGGGYNNNGYTTVTPPRGGTYISPNPTTIIANGDVLVFGGYQTTFVSGATIFSPFGSFYSLPPFISTRYVINNAYPFQSYKTVGSIAPWSDTDRFYAENEGRGQKLRATLNDVTRFWEDEDVRGLRRHTGGGTGAADMVGVFKDQKYSYSLRRRDFLDLALDALDRTETIAFRFKDVRERSDGLVDAYATHTYKLKGDGKAARNQSASVYLSLVFSEGEWYISGVSFAPKTAE